MFRVKLKVDPKVLQQFYQRVKTGVRGIGIVRTSHDGLAGRPSGRSSRNDARPSSPRSTTYRTDTARYVALDDVSIDIPAR